MQIKATIINVGKFSPESTFKGEKGDEITVPAKRQLIGQQDCGDIIVLRARCEENHKWETGKPYNFSIINFAKSKDMIFLDCEVVK